MRHPWLRLAFGAATLLLASLGAASAGTAPAGASDAGPPPLDRAEVSAFVDGAVREAMRTDHIAGVTVAIVDRSGVVMTRGYGVASLSPARPVDADTLFRVGSISKTGVWIALMQLVEAGKIGLDDPVNQHLPPALRIPDQGFSQPIRVRHLMTHSPGFEDSVLQDFFTHDPARLVPLEVFLRTHRVRRVREPGTVSVYSNYGASLAGAMVAYVSGQSWQDYAEQHVLRPLGMATATYREPYPTAVAQARGLAAPMPAATAAKVTDGFTYAAGALRQQAFEYASVVAPAGALSASANDMAAYMRALLDPALMQSAGVMRADTALAMRAPLFGNTPELGQWRHGFMDFSASSGRPGFGHDGDLIYQHSTMQIYPDAGVAIFISVNTPTGLPLLETLPDEILDRFVGPLPRPVRAADAKAEAAAVAGTYRPLRVPARRTERALISFFGMARVTALPNGDILVGQTRLMPVGGGVFARTDGPARIAFHKVGGRMRLFDPFSAGPADRVGYFEGPQWLSLISALGVLVAIWGVASGVRRLLLRRETAAAMALDGVCLIWLAAFALLAAAVAPFLGDPLAAVFVYPGKLLPLACWALMVAAVATPAGAVLAVGPLHPQTWSWWRWTRVGVATAVLAALALTLDGWGFLGFSGW
jgi:CubicO group peptidase (beta-lactamase class C family)